MMGEKRLTYVNLANNYYQIREVDDDGYCRRLSPTHIIDLLNEQQAMIKELEKVNEDLREVNKENQLLHEENVKQCERWKRLYEIKDAEVTARVDGLNKVCNYYLNEVLFKSDTDPNKAVKEVIHEILNTEVKNDE